MGLLCEALGGAEITSSSCVPCPYAAHDFAKEQDLEQLNSIRITEREWAMAMPTVEFKSGSGQSVLTVLCNQTAQIYFMNVQDARF